MQPSVKEEVNLCTKQAWGDLVPLLRKAQPLFLVVMDDIYKVKLKLLLPLCKRVKRCFTLIMTENLIVNKTIGQFKLL